MKEPIHIISLGAGVQSYTMFRMAQAGLIQPVPVAAVFADTGWELAETIALVKSLQSPDAAIKVHIVGKRSLRDAAFGCSKSDWWPGIPVYIKNKEGQDGKLGRKCTTTFKVSLLEAFSKRLMKNVGADRVIQWKGITTDEIYRMKPSRKDWYEIRWPLCELKMSRQDCISYLIRNGYHVPSRSACIGCPYHDNEYWRWLKETHPKEWQEAIRFDAHIRNNVKGARFPAFIHRSLKPLSEVDLSTEEERGQLDMFNNECEGMCGV